MVRSSVVLPQPLGPSRATKAPGSMSSEMPFKTFRLPYSLTSPAMVMPERRPPSDSIAMHVLPGER